MTEKTKNYDMFKKHPSNREYDEGNILKIMKSIEAKNLLEYRPILVNGNYEIIDGQHRLEAARRLEVPIFYEVKKDVQTSDMILLNNSVKSWGRDDYLNYFANEGFINYIKLKNFMNKHKLKLTAALVILGQNGSMQRGSSFKTGEFKFPEEKEKAHSEDILRKSRQVVDYITPKLSTKPKFVEGSHFLRGLYIVLCIQALDFDTFMGKISHRLDLLRPCIRIRDYVNMFKQIYNWKNRDPIVIVDENLELN